MTNRMSGEVDPFLRALLRVVVRGPDGQGVTAETKVDTGFSMSLALPEQTIAALGLRYRRDRLFLLADGQAVHLREYEARILWEGIERPLRVHAKSGDPVSGMALFSGYRLIVEVVDGGTVTVEPLS